MLRNIADSFYGRHISMTQVIILNGCSSAGKTTLAIKLQQLLDQPYQYVGLDQFRDGMPARVRGLNAPASTEGALGLNVVPVSQELTAIEFGVYGDQVLRLMRQSAALFAEQGVPVIIDDLLLKPEYVQDYVNFHDPMRTWMIGVKCAESVVVEREANRGGRFPGTALEHFERVHADIDAYDLEIDTSELSVRSAAEAVIDRLKEPPKCLAQLKARIRSR